MDIAAKLIKENITISTIESCTSGLVASTITDTEGASAIFKGGFVTYSNEIKEKVGVDHSIIEKYGVYSKECAYEMAKTAKEFFKTDIAISITGTTGNIDPNNSDSIKGKAYFCIIYLDKIHNFEIECSVDGLTRHQIKELYVGRIFKELSDILGGLND